MPKISEFFGIIIRMRYDDHNQPHFHIFYSGEKASYQVSPLMKMAGDVSPRANRMIMDWAKAHTEELLAEWDRLRRHEQPVWIPGLE